MTIVNEGPTHMRKSALCAGHSPGCGVGIFFSADARADHGPGGSEDTHGGYGISLWEDMPR